MSVPKREQILEALKTALETITTDNGYNYTVKKVSRKYEHYSETNKFPALYIITGPGDIEQLDGRLKVEKEKFSIGIRGYVHGKKDTQDQGLLSKALEKMIQDIRTCIAKNRRLDLSYVYYVLIDAIDPYTDWSANIGICDVIIEVQYKYLALEP